MPQNVLALNNRIDFRNWLKDHYDTETECWLLLKRGKPVDDEHFWYLDAVEEALCFGWIDSTFAIVDGKRMQRFSPRRKNSAWTELNKERVRRLERLGLMTDAGRAVLPSMDIASFAIPWEIELALRESDTLEKFKSFPALYQRIRAYNVMFYLKRDRAAYEKALMHLIDMTKQGNMYGEWNDYGRLL